jgi:hypothetical protein
VAPEVAGSNPVIHPNPHIHPTPDHRHRIQNCNGSAQLSAARSLLARRLRSDLPKKGNVYPELKLENGLDASISLLAPLTVQIPGAR